MIDGEDLSTPWPLPEEDRTELDDERGDALSAAEPAAAARPGGEASADVLAALLQRIARQDEAALGALYDATLGRVYGLALRILRDPQAAEEATEDAYFQIWRQAPRYDPARGRPLAWMLSIVRSRALDQLRRTDDALVHPDPAELMAPVPDSATEPAALGIAREARDELHRALCRLEPLPRQLIALAFLRGLTHEEIAAHQGLPVGTVKSHIRRALGALKKALEGHPATTRSES
jgi:RNA polymerase sigma-70 factor (ECF subfamily)